MKTEYRTIDRSAQAVFTDRGSRFIAHAFPAETPETFRTQLSAIKKEHPKAVHHCFAYRMGAAGDLFRCSDDGEPSGSAGRPILGQIDSRELTNTAVVVVRYFGGTLLGIPGLINAYKTSTSMVLQLLPIVRRNVEMRYALEFDYTCLDAVLTLLNAQTCSILKKELQLFCSITAGVPVHRETEFLEKLGRIQGISVRVV